MLEVSDTEKWKKYTLTSTSPQADVRKRRKFRVMLSVPCLRLSCSRIISITKCSIAFCCIAYLGITGTSKRSFTSRLIGMPVMRGSMPCIESSSVTLVGVADPDPEPDPPPPPVPTGGDAHCSRLDASPEKDTYTSGPKKNRNTSSFRGIARTCFAQVVSPYPL